MPTTTPATILGPDFVSDVVKGMLKTIAEATAHGYRIVWDAAWESILAHIWLTLGFLAFILLASALQAFATGSWGWFGSVLYHYFYIGFIILIGFVWGPEVFANDYIDLGLFLLYVLCFWMVGKILKKFGFIRRF